MTKNLRRVNYSLVKSEIILISSLSGYYIGAQDN